MSAAASALRPRPPPGGNRSSRSLSGGGSAELLEQLDERRALGLRESTRRQIHRRLVARECLGRLLFARRRQPNDASPSVARVGLARDQAAGRQPRPRHVSTDHDPLFRFHRWLAHLLRIRHPHLYIRGFSLPPLCCSRSSSILAPRASNVSGYSDSTLSSVRVARALYFAAFPVSPIFCESRK